jgi:histidinol phosphatase-like enzyme
MDFADEGKDQSVWRKAGMPTAKTIEYKGFQIRYRIGIIKQHDMEAGKYAASEFSIGYCKNELYTEQQYIQETKLFDTEAEAEAAIVQQAKQIIEEQYL